MSEQEVSADQVGAQIRGDFEEMVSETEAALVTAAAKGVGIVAKDTPSDRGQARAGWSFRDVDGGADLYNDVPYIGVLEAGRRPGTFPPLEPIIRWVVRNFGLNLEVMEARQDAEEAGVVGDDAVRAAEHHVIQQATQHVPGNDMGQVPSATRGLAYVIARKISEEGSEPHHMVRDNLDRLTELAQQEVENRLRNL